MYVVRNSQIHSHFHRARGRIAAEDSDKNVLGELHYLFAGNESLATAFAVSEWAITRDLDTFVQAQDDQTG